MTTYVSISRMLHDMSFPPLHIRHTALLTPLPALGFLRHGEADEGAAVPAHREILSKLRHLHRVPILDGLNERMQPTAFLSGKLDPSRPHEGYLTSLFEYRDTLEVTEGGGEEIAECLLLLLPPSVQNVGGS